MKKTLWMFLFVLSLSILAIGCSTGTTKDDGNIDERFDNMQKIEVSAADDSTVTSISENQELEGFVEALKIEAWDPAELPANAEEGNAFKLFQEDTVKMFDSKKKERKLSEVAVLITYNDTPYVTFSTKGFSFHFNVPNDVTEYLNSIK